MSFEEDLSYLTIMFKAAGIEIIHMHKEAGPGQLEIALGYCEVSRSIENYLLARMIITRYFQKKGLLVSFLPKTFSD